MWAWIAGGLVSAVVVCGLTIMQEATPVRPEPPPKPSPDQLVCECFCTRYLDGFIPEREVTAPPPQGPTSRRSLADL